MTVLPGFNVARTVLRTSVAGVGFPVTETIRSPGWIPAFAAGPFGVTAPT